MAELALDVVVAKWPHIPPNGLLFGCIVIMAIGLGIALRWPHKPPKTPKN
ncbi:MAG: hypothetical protein ACRDYF_12130 [Acidimicrobiia bacterium]